MYRLRAQQVLGSGKQVYMVCWYLRKPQGKKQKSGFWWYLVNSVQTAAVSVSPFKIKFGRFLPILGGAVYLRIPVSGLTLSSSRDPKHAESLLSVLRAQSLRGLPGPAAQRAAAALHAPGAVCRVLRQRARDQRTGEQGQVGNSHGAMCDWIHAPRVGAYRLVPEQSPGR